VYRPPDSTEWMCATVAAVVVQGIVPDTCEIVVPGSDAPRRRREGHSQGPLP
jgi:hypothetical protein